MMQLKSGANHFSSDRNGANKGRVTKRAQFPNKSTQMTS